MKPTEKIDPALQPKKGEFTSVIDELLSEIEGAEVAHPAKFSLVVAGKTIWFRRPESVQDLRLFKKYGLEFIIRMADVEKLPKSLQEQLKGRTTDDLIAAFTIHHWSVEPTKIDQIQALRMTKAPGLVDGICEAINRAFDMGLESRVYEGIAEAKKGLRRTSSDASRSRSPRRSTANTLKTSTPEDKSA